MPFSRPSVIVILTLILLTTVASSTSADTMWWKRGYGGTGHDYGASVTTDSQGSIIVAGAFSGSIDLGGGELVSAGSWDVFVAKFDVDGDHIWSYRYGSTSSDVPVAVATDPWGNVFVLGRFERTVDFGGGPYTCTGGILPDVFLAKYGGMTGAHLWSKRFGGASFDSPGGIAVDDVGRSVITGAFTGTTDFGGGSVTSAGITDVFVAKYSPAGNHVWSKTAGNSSSQGGWAVAVDATGTHLYSGGFGDSYDGDQGLGLAIDPSGDLVMTGRFAGTADFGRWPPLTSTSGSYDAFVAKFTSNPTGIGSSPSVGARLLQNYPNPFNPATRIGYSIARATHVRLAVYDVRGRAVAVLVDRVQPAGAYAAELASGEREHGCVFHPSRCGRRIAHAQSRAPQVGRDSPFALKPTPRLLVLAALLAWSLHPW